VTEIIKGDAFSVVKAWNGTRKFDLLCTEPPFSPGGQGISEHELTAEVSLILYEAAKLVREGGWAVIMSASSDRSFSHIRNAVGKVLVPVRIATWCRLGATTKVNNQRGWNYDTYLVLTFRHPKGRKGRKEKPEPSRLPGYIVAPPLKGGRRAQLPDEVCDWLVKPFAVPGGTLLDLFCGNGGILKAGERRGMDCVGIDLEPGEVAHATLPEAAAAAGGTILDHLRHHLPSRPDGGAIRLQRPAQ
jgi:hypothetical protein